ADAPTAESDGAGAADGPDAAHHGGDLAADDRVLRPERTRGPGPLLVCGELRQYHSAELRRRVGKRAAEALQASRGRGLSGVHEQSLGQRPEDAAAGDSHQTQESQEQSSAIAKECGT